MNRAAIAEARVFASWLDYQDALKRAVAPLTEEQLAQRPLAGRRTPGELAEHIVFGRALHLHRALGDAAVELVPLLRWEDDDAPPRSAAELVEGLESTWRIIVACIALGTATDTVAEGAAAQNMQGVWGLLDHDLPHAGQLSMLLRAGGLAGVEI